MRRRLIPLILIVTLAAAGLMAVVLTSSSPYLGLDLQGGLSVVLEPVTEADDEELDLAVSIIRDRVDALGVAEPEITRQGDAVVVQLPGVDDDDRDRIVELIGTTAELRFRPVLTEPIPAPEDEEDAEGEDDGGEEGEDAEGEGQGQNAESAEGQDADGQGQDAESAEGEDGQGEGQDGEGQGQDGEGQDAGDQPAAASYCGVEQEPADEAAEGDDAEGDDEAGGVTPPAEDLPGQQVAFEDIEGALLYSLGPTPCFTEDDDGNMVPDPEGNLLATGRIVDDAQATLNQGVWTVRLKMHSGARGIDMFNAVASSCFSRSPECPTSKLAIVLDSKVQSAPGIQAATYERDQIVISGGSDPETGEGGFSEGDAKDLARLLRYGALPVELEQRSLQTVSATLGEDSLRAGVVAGIVGVILVVMYMTFYYRALGLVVVAGMAVWAALLYTVIAWLGTTQGLALTLAGVTGIIISVGVMVDSYVVYFERLKDDVKLGRSLRTSADRAFKRSFRTILAANTATLIGAVVLWYWTVGAVRGFAFFLGLSAVLGVLVTALYTRSAVTLLAGSRFFTEARGIGFSRALAASTPPEGAPAGGGSR